MVMHYKGKTIDPATIQFQMPELPGLGGGAFGLPPPPAPGGNGPAAPTPAQPAMPDLSKPPSFN
jgi:hypothetical protein